MARYADDYLSAPLPVTRYIGFDCCKPPYDDARIRQAVLVAVVFKLNRISKPGESENQPVAEVIPTNGKSPILRARVNNKQT